MKITINDVAKYAGVSMKTVSRVMNNEPSVRKKTSDKVKQAVKELNYQPSIAARNLAGSKSYAVGLVYDNPNAYYVLDMQNGILSKCREQGYELFIHPCKASDPEMEDELQTMVKRSRISGLVLTPPLSEREEVLSLLSELDLQYVRILSGQEPKEKNNSCIFINDRDAAYSITEHLIQLGHKRIGFLAGDEQHKSTDERLAGFRQAMNAYRLPVDESLIVAGKYSFESGVEGAKTLLNSASAPTAIFAGNDEIAAGALFAARLMNVSIPSQLSITGFEDSPFSRQTWPKLTTAKQSNELIAQHAAKLLLSKTRSDSTNQAEMVKCFTPELVVRDSTGPAPLAQPVTDN